MPEIIFFATISSYSVKFWMLTLKWCRVHSFSESFLGLCKQKCEEPWARPMGAGVMKKTGLFSFFPLVEIPGKRIWLHVFKPLSNNLTKEDSCQTLIGHPKIHSLFSNHLISSSLSLYGICDVSMSFAFLLLKMNLF